VTVPDLMLVIGLIWRSMPRETPEGQPPHIPLLRLALLGLGVLSVVGSGQVASVGLRLTLIASAGVWVVLALAADAHAAHQLFPSQPFALTTPVGTGFWIVFLFGATTSQVNVYLPLVVQILHGISPLGAGYFSVLRGMSWTASALCTPWRYESRWDSGERHTLRIYMKDTFCGKCKGGKLCQTACRTHQQHVGEKHGAHHVL
jgi:hypothetical protein